MEEVNKLIDTAEALILKELEKQARLYLKDDSNYTYEFFMAMGTYFFTNDAGKILYSFKNEVLDSLVTDYDKMFFITGNPMRFTADGPVITDW